VKTQRGPVFIWGYGSTKRLRTPAFQVYTLLTKVFLFFISDGRCHTLQEFQRKYQESIKALESELDHLEVSFKFGRRKRFKLREE
jgi:hypothetical protein